MQMHIEHLHVVDVGFVLGLLECDGFLVWKEY